MPNGTIGRRVRGLLRPVVIASALLSTGCDEPGDFFYVEANSEIGEDGRLVPIEGDKKVTKFQRNQRDSLSPEALLFFRAACGTVIDPSTGNSLGRCILAYAEDVDVDQPAAINDFSVNGDTAAVALGSGGLVINVLNGTTARLGIPAGESVTKVIVPAGGKEVIAAGEKVNRCNTQIVVSRGARDLQTAHNEAPCVQIPGNPPGIAVDAMELLPSGDLIIAFPNDIRRLQPGGQELLAVSAPTGVTYTCLGQYDGNILAGTLANGVMVILPGGGVGQLNTRVNLPYDVSWIAWYEAYLAVAGKKDGNPFVVRSSDGGLSWGPREYIPIHEGVSVATIDSLVFVPPVNGGAGNAISPLADPPPVLFAGTNAGVFRSTDNGASWAPFNQGVASATVTRVLVTPERVYAGTFRNANAVYRSSDGLNFSPGNSVLANQAARALAAVGDNVVASGETGIFRSTDGGATWVKGVSGLPAGTYFFGMITLGTTMLGGSPYISAASPGGVYRSTDGGATWTRTSQGLPVNINVNSFAASGSLVVAYVATSSARAIYRSTDGGLTWSKGAEFAQGSPVALAFSGATLYAGLTGTAPEHLYRSADGGLTFTASGSGLGNRQSSRWLLPVTRSSPERTPAFTPARTAARAGASSRSGWRGSPSTRWPPPRAGSMRERSGPPSGSSRFPSA